MHKLITTDLLVDWLWEFAIYPVEATGDGVHFALLTGQEFDVKYDQQRKRWLWPVALSNAIMFG